MKPGDRVYYLYTGKDGTPIKFPSVVLSLEDDGVMIRVGRFDVHKKDVKTFESVVPAKLLQPRTLPCSYEDELTSPARS